MQDKWRLTMLRCNARIARLWTTAGMAMLLTGCATGITDRGACAAIPVHEYSREMQTQAALELGTMPRGSAVRILVNDYGEMRARVRSVCG